MNFFGLQVPQWLLGSVGALILSAAALALPAPHPATSFWTGVYLWFYNFTHAILANWGKITSGNGFPPPQPK
jgi:hypothetical protein